MNQILKQILSFDAWQNQYDTFAPKNNLNSVNYKLVQQQNFQNFQILQKQIQKGPRKSKKRWVSNERRILYVFLNCISVMYNLSVEEFQNDQIQRITRVFPYKDKYSIQYELKKLTNNFKQNRRRWSQKQEKILQQILEKAQSKNKWNEIARDLFISSQGQYFRQGKHCRERFYKLQQAKEKSPSEREIKNNSQFQSRIEAKNQKENSISSQSLSRAQNLNFRNFNVKNQPDYDKMVIRYNSNDQNLQKGQEKQEKNNKFNPRNAQIYMNESGDGQHNNENNLWENINIQKIEKQFYSQSEPALGLSFAQNIHTNEQTTAFKKGFRMAHKICRMVFTTI